MSVEVDAARALIEASDSGLRLERGTVVDQDAPSPAHAMVRLADGLVVPALGACALGADVTLIVGGGVVMLMAPPRVGLTAIRAAAQSIPNVSGTNISWTSKTGDTSGFLIPTSTTVTIQHPGVYALSCQVDFTSGLGGRCYLEIRIDGSVVRRFRQPFAVSGEDRASVGATPPLAVGDTIVVQVYHSSGADRSLTATLDVWRVAW